MTIILPKCPLRNQSLLGARPRAPYSHTPTLQHSRYFYVPSLTLTSRSRISMKAMSISRVCYRYQCTVDL